MRFNYRVPLLTQALNWERTIYPTPSARVPLKASLGGKACHWDVWCSETGVILGGRPKKTVQHVQGCYAWTSGPPQRALWPGQVSEQQRSALIRTLSRSPHALRELYSTGGACHGAVFPFLLLSMIYQCGLNCICSVQLFTSGKTIWTTFKTLILEYVISET